MSAGDDAPFGPAELARFDQAGVAVGECSDCERPVPVLFLSPGWEEPVRCARCERRAADAAAALELGGERGVALLFAVLCGIPAAGLALVAMAVRCW